MSFSKKFALIAVLILGGFSGTCLADAPSSYIYIPEREIYSKSSVQQTLDEAKARRIIAGLKDVDLNQIWFATGLENYYKSPACVTAEGVWLFTKPVLSSSGIWRGKKGYILEESKDNSETTCNQLVIVSPKFLLDLNTASFIDPTSMHPEEAWDGIVPGIFHVYNDISDDELNYIANVITQARECISNDSQCPFAIERNDVYMSKRQLVATVNTGSLAYIQEQPSANQGKPCYSMIFEEPGPWAGALAMDICYRGDKQVTKVTLSTDVLE